MAASHRAALLTVFKYRFHTLAGYNCQLGFPHMTSLDSFKCRKTLKVGSKTYVYYSLPTAEKNGLKGISKLPYSMKVLLENLLRHEDGRTVTKTDIEAMAGWLQNRGKTDKEIGFRPAPSYRRAWRRGRRRPARR